MLSVVLSVVCSLPLYCNDIAKLLGHEMKPLFTYMHRRVPLVLSTIHLRIVYRPAPQPPQKLIPDNAASSDLKSHGIQHFTVDALLY